MIRALNNWIRDKGDRHLGGHALFLFWMTAFFAVFGAIDFGEPLEDFMQETRNIVRSQPASGDIVFVGIDQETVESLPNFMGDRSFDAKIVDNLFAAGAKRVYYDRTHGSAGTPEGDQKFRAALKKYEGRFFIGHIGTIDNVDSDASYLGDKKTLFGNEANALSIVARFAPFSLSVDLPYNHFSNENKSKSFSYHISDTRFNEDNADLFRPDFSIQSSTIPTYSYIDIYNKNKINALKDKIVVVGLNEFSLGDMVYLPSQGYIPGAYVHIIGAETLHKGQPQNFGWVIVFAVGIAISTLLLFMTSYRHFIATSGLILAVFIVVPFLLDAALINVDVLPGFLLILAVIIRSSITRFAENSAQTNRLTGIKNFIALQDGEPQRTETMVAIKVRNFGAIAGRFDKSVEADIYREITRRIALMSPEPEVYQSADTLIWMTPHALNEDLLNSLSGINNLSQAYNFVIDQQPLEVSLAFGVEADVERPVEARLIDALANAENAARANQLYSVASDKAREHESRKLDLLTHFDNAINNGEIWAAYQPKINPKTGRFKSAEALARWSNEAIGTISAAEFITLAESNNRILELTIAMLDHSMKALKLTESVMPGFNISVNISPRLLLNPNFENFILNALQSHNVRACCLTLEIIETDKLDMAHAEPVLNRLSQHGIRLSVDDYGTGQATLDYLRTETFHEIKIDRKFISKMDVNKSDREMVEATIKMSHSLNKTVVAEGVEHGLIGEMLSDMGCDEVQGFYYAHPMTCDNLMAMLEAQERTSKNARTG